MFYKSIIQGRLTFGTRKSYDKVVKMYEYRTETYYKNDILLEKEDIFSDELMVLTVPRFVGNATDKGFKNTISLLHYCAQFAVAGAMQAWMIEEGQVLNQAEIAPDSDRAVVQQFNKGDILFKEGGKEEEAIEAFNKTIERYNMHAQAYERRGWTNMHLHHFQRALDDFNKSISLDDSIAYAYYGKAIIKHNEHNLTEAIANYELALKKSVALQPLYWKARLRKAECHIELGQWDKAHFDLKFFHKRKFKEGDTNRLRKPRGASMFGRVLYEMGEHKEAVLILTEALEFDIPDAKGFNKSETYYYRGMAKKALRKRDHKIDLAKAEELGYKPPE